MVFYNHLPRHTVSANDTGTLTDCIGWVIVHPNLYSHVEARISHLPEVKDLIDIYRSFARAAPSYGVLVNYNKRTLAPRSEKKKVDQVANKAYQAVIQAAEKVLSMLANPQIVGALSDLMPLRNQHGTHSWGHIFWPQRLDDYPGSIEVDKDEDADVSTPDPEAEAIKWGQTSEESTPSLVSSRSDSPYSEVESFDLFPELNHLELSTVDEVDKLPEEEFHKALKVAVRAPSPPPPPPTTVTKNVEEPHGHCGFFRGTGEDQLGYVNSNGDIFVVPNNPFGISVTRIMVAYHLQWPEASVRTTMAATLLIDNVLTRRGNFPAFKIEAERTLTTYRQALGMSAAESAQWDCIWAFKSHARKCNNNWLQLLLLAECTYNNAPSATTGISPFFANKGYNPAISVYPERDLTSAQAYYTLSEKFLGLFTIIAQVRTHSFTLRLPDSMRVVHSVFHVSQLKPATPNTIPGHIQTPPPPILVDREPEYEITEILDSKIDCRRRSCQLLYLVRWAGYKGTDEETSWILATELGHAQKLISDFHSAYPSKPGPLAKLS
ncbi:hypothetical protein ONZ51_g3764 [Trametes cubensis]|uniref:Chromo domain-containing protein n=1 Tax=Trametes cubensis TaxID=1111947 RepID=A0AAD7XFB7_9APHY|nr:hypothetical protein ONZ51_g3764 [Trametes cubensis]